jgi:hypothetical protein
LPKADQGSVLAEPQPPQQFVAPGNSIRVQGRALLRSEEELSQIRGPKRPSTPGGVDALTNLADVVRLDELGHRASIAAIQPLSGLRGKPEGLDHLGCQVTHHRMTFDDAVWTLTGATPDFWPLNIHQRYVGRFSAGGYDDRQRLGDAQRQRDVAARLRIGLSPGPLKGTRADKRQRPVNPVADTIRARHDDGDRVPPSSGGVCCTDRSKAARAPE